MTDREVIREVPSDGGLGNIVLGIIILALIGLLIWAFASGKLDFTNRPAASTTNNYIQTTPSTTTSNGTNTNNPATSTDTKDNTGVNVNVGISGGMR